jgi:hypothetical protein
MLMWLYSYVDLRTCDVLFSCSFVPMVRPYVEEFVVCTNGCVGPNVQTLAIVGRYSIQKGGHKISVYLMMAAIGRNMQYMQTHIVYVPELCRLNKNKHCITI